MYEEFVSACTRLGIKAKVRLCGDMKWHWSCLLKGGGCYTKPYFCYHCETHKTEALHLSYDQCSGCREDAGEGDQVGCYHREVIMETDEERLLREVNDIREQFAGPGNLDTQPNFSIYLPNRLHFGTNQPIPEMH